MKNCSIQKISVLNTEDTTLNECFTLHGSGVIADKFLVQEKRFTPYVFKKYEVILVATFLSRFCALPGMDQIS